MNHIASFRRIHRPSAVCLVVEGEIDAESVADFTAAIFDAVIVADDAAVLDLTKVVFFGSEAISSLITGQALANDHAVSLIIEPSHIVQRVLEVVGVTDCFELREKV
jgi:anti-sigma B factor antagonist